MSIIVTPQSEYSQSNLNQTDIASLIAAISSVISLPQGFNWTNVNSINISFFSSSSGNIGINTLVNS